MCSSLKGAIALTACNSCSGACQQGLSNPASQMTNLGLLQLRMPMIRTVMQTSTAAKAEQSSSPLADLCTSAGAWSCLAQRCKMVLY